MDGHINVPFVGDREERASTPGNSAGSPFSGGSADGKISGASSPKRSRRAVKKRVVSVPISEAEGSRMKGEGAPPSDSWAWRKYGQKPIKGSPYPRGYYRCSSSKGCPARKQVERSRADPTMLLVTYACEHNHPGPTPRNAASSSAATAAPTSPAPPPKPPADEPAVFSNPPEVELVETFRDLADDALFPDGFSWFSDVSSSPPSKEALLHSPICGGGHVDDAEVAAAAILFPMREEDESLFADLGELPECSVVFRRGLCERSGSMIAAPWCGSTG